MNHIECSRCAAQFPHPLALLEHHDTVHGGWAVRYPDDPHSDADWEPYTALLGFRRMGEAILARAEEVRQEWYEPEEEAIDDVGQN